MNDRIISQFQILEEYYRRNKDTFRARAYENVIILIENFPEKITDIEQIKSVKGIGKSIKEKIKEYLDYGDIKNLDKYSIKSLLSDSKSKVINDFLCIQGVGVVRAEKLYSEGYRSISDIRNSKLSLTTQQKIGVKYYEELLVPISRQTINIFQVSFRYILNEIFGKNSYKMDVAGSYRREKETSGDVDILITSDKFKLRDIVDIMVRHGIITDIISFRDEKLMCISICKGQKPCYHFRLDIEFLPKSEYATGLLYFTGSKNFNIALRANVKKRGMLLNQHGLYDKNGKLYDTRTEEEIFKILGLNYVEPKKR